MRVSIPTQEFDDELRRAIRHHCGPRPGLATREECRAWFLSYGSSADDDILAELRESDSADADT